MQWFENDAFWQTFYPWMYDERRFATAADEVGGVLTLSGIEKGTALDLCCGPGRHSLVLAQKGFEVTAVDRSPFLLGKARERTAGSRIEFIEADMREFVRAGAFDLILNLFTSFGYFENTDDDLKVLRNARSSLKKNGCFIIDVMSKEHLASQPCRTRWERFANDEILIQHFEVIPGWSRLRVQWCLIQGDHASRFDFVHNLYSGQELTALLERAEFSDIQLFGSFEGTPYDSSATRLIARAYVT